jgi:tRNA pseudouridine55 synthase
MNNGCRSGILLVDKEEGLSSHEVVALVKRALGGRRGPKVGHAGTLDPFATGLLVVIVGQATKLSRYLTSEDKTYLAVLKLGETTDTLDPTGQVVKRVSKPMPTSEEIRVVSRKFTGVVEQTPPMYSALKINGVRAYSLARKGRQVALKKRNVNIFELDLLDYQEPYATMKIACSAGTYIRSLAADLGEAMGSAAYLTALRRLRVGRFHTTDALNSSELRPGAACREKLLERLLDPVEALDRMPLITVSSGLAARIRRGYRPEAAEIGAGPFSPAGDEPFKVVAGGRLVAVGRLGRSESKDRNGFIAERVFPEEDL